MEWMEYSKHIPTANDCVDGFMCLCCCDNDVLAAYYDLKDDVFIGTDGLLLNNVSYWCYFPTAPSKEA